MKRILIIILLLIIAAAAAIYFFAGDIGRQYINQHGPDIIGRRMQVETFHLNIINGNASLNNVTVYEQHGDSVFAHITDLDVDMNLLDLLQGRITIENLDIADATVNIIKQDTTYNFDDIVQFMSHGEAHDYAIGHLALSRATVNIHDITDTLYPFHYSLHDLSAEADDFTARGINTVSVKGQLGNGGSADVKYIGRLADYDNMSIMLTLDKVQLQAFTPYFTRFFGRSVTDGQLSLTSEIFVNNGSIDAKNHLTLDNPKVEKLRDLPFTPEYKKVPLKTALYLLTDKNGRCEMDLPVTGSITDPHFSYKNALMKCFGKALLKTINPF